MMNSLIDDTIDDCHTDEYINVNLQNEAIAEKYNYRYFLDEKTGKVTKFDLNKHKDLIGSIIKFRSPITCKCQNKHYVCRKCYGDLALVNKNIHAGIVAVLELTEQLTQHMLSAKHLQTTKSRELKWDNKFLDYFIVDKGNIYCNTNKANGNMSIIIPPDSIEYNDSNEIQISSLIINEDDKETFINLPIEINPTELIEDLIESSPIKDDEDRIILNYKNLDNVSSIHDGEPVFTFTLENKELSATLTQIIELIESSDHGGIDNIHDLVNKFNELLIEGQIKLNSVHSELILSELIRKKSDITKYPDRYDCQNDPTNDNYYVILKVSEAILNSGSSAQSISYERIKTQLATPEFYLKDDDSLIDEFYLN